MTPHRKLTTVKNYRYLEGYRHTAVDQDFIELIADAYARGPAARKVSSVSVKLFECVAQALNVRLTLQPFPVKAFWQTSLVFVGAINSEQFVFADRQWRFNQTKAFRHALEELRSDGYLVPPLLFKSSKDNLDPSLEDYVDLFESLSVDEEVAWLWKGWSSTNADGDSFFFPLHPIYYRLGQAFTQRLFESLAARFAGIRNPQLPMIRSIANFIGSYSGHLNAQRFKDPDFTTRFWEEFFSYYSSARQENGDEVSSILTAWNAHSRLVIEGCLEASDLFARPSGGMPAVPSRIKRGVATNIRKTPDGIEVKEKLLTHVPLHVSDEEAIQLLFRDIQRDVDSIEKWAKAAVARCKQAVNERHGLAAQGTPRLVQAKGSNFPGIAVLTDRSNPEYLANCAATFERMGFATQRDTPVNLLYPRPHREIANQLGLPTFGQLLPHATLLVFDCPKITPSFLEKLELFDKAGQQTGYVNNDNGAYLCGSKERAGAWQEISLGPQGIDAIETLIKMTRPLRNYLRERGDDAWRFLLLTSGVGFAYPRRAGKLAVQCSDPGIRDRNLPHLADAAGLSIEDAAALWRRFSISALRASLGVLVYLKTGSVQEMAKALGHSEYEPRLIEHYLPTPILQFFQSRWVRLFQTGMITSVMDGSPLLVEASGLKSMAEVHRFLEKHAFQPLETSTNDPKPSDSKVMLGVDEQVLSVMLEVQRAVDNSSTSVSAQARYWASLSKRLVHYIECEANGREDLQIALENARRNPSQMSFDKLVQEIAHV